jgi:uncharacterized protein (TIGR02118 family)
MVKVMLLLARQPDMRVEEFRRYWHEQHRPLLERLPGLRRLVFNDVLPGADGASPEYDGVSEDWFDSPEAMQAAFASAEGQAVMADAAQFLDLARLRVLMVEEHDVTLAGSMTAA